MELTTKRKLTALGTNNMKKMVVIMSTVLASIIFTCRSYEYQILLAKNSSLASSLYIQKNDTHVATSQLISIELIQRPARVCRRGPTGGTRLLFTPLLLPFRFCPTRHPRHQRFPHHCICHLRAAITLTSYATHTHPSSDTPTASLVMTKNFP